MSDLQLEQRPLYGIGTVARLTGLKPDTLRVWERRYGLGASHKSATGRRQYTQADLEHLQLIAALVGAGSRIGEIASAERKTLEILVRNQCGSDARGRLERKPRALFIGGQLCHWLDQHQGCIAGVEALLARENLQDVGADALVEQGTVHTLVAECPTLSSATVGHLRGLVQATEPTRTIVVYHYGNQRWLEELDRLEFIAMSYPPEPGALAFQLARASTAQEATAGDSNLGDLMPAKPRRFSQDELTVAAELRNTLDCECPRHLSELIHDLLHFEEYSSACSVDNWQDAAVHARIYAYTAQARHLIEKALGAVLEERSEEFSQQLAALRAERRRDGKAAERVSDVA